MSDRIQLDEVSTGITTVTASVANDDSQLPVLHLHHQSSSNMEPHLIQQTDHIHTDNHIQITQIQPDEDNMNVNNHINDETVIMVFQEDSNEEKYDEHSHHADEIHNRSPIHSPPTNEFSDTEDMLEGIRGAVDKVQQSVDNDLNDEATTKTNWFNNDSETHTILYTTSTENMSDHEQQVTTDRETFYITQQQKISVNSKFYKIVCSQKIGIELFLFRRCYVLLQ